MSFKNLNIYHINKGESIQPDEINLIQVKYNLKY